MKREIGKHSSDVFQDGRRRPLDPPHTLYHGADETSARVSRCDSPSNNDLLRNATATAASLLSSFCLCICACECECVGVWVCVNRVRFTSIPPVRHTRSKNTVHPRPHRSTVRHTHTRAIRVMYRFAKPPQKIPTVWQRAT